MLTDTTVAHDESRRHLLSDTPDEDPRSILDQADANAGTTQAAPSVPLRDARVEADAMPEVATYGRHLSWTSAYILIVSRIVGSGIFATPGAVLKSSGSIGLSLLVWLGGAIIAACGLAATLEYGCMLPRSGGEKVYLEFTYRSPPYLALTVLTAKAVLQGFTASNCIVFSHYLLFGLQVKPTRFAKDVTAIALLVLVSAVHGCALRTGVHIQNALGWFKIGFIIFTLVTALGTVLYSLSGQLNGDDNAAVAPTRTSLWENSNWGWEPVSMAIFKVQYAYAGYENASYVLNEVKDPIGMLKVVAPLALATVFILYQLINIAFFAVIPLEKIREAGDLVAALFFNDLFGSRIGGTLLPLLVALSVAGNVMVAIYSQSRLNQEIARQGLLPRIFASSRPYSAPLGGIAITFVPTLLIILFRPPGDIYSFILDAEGYISTIFGLALAIGLLWLRQSRADLWRPFRAWRTVIVFRVVICFALLAAPFIPFQSDGTAGFWMWQGSYALVGIGLVNLSILGWFIWVYPLTRWKGYHLKERVGVLEDGTTFISIERVPEDGL